MKINELNCKLQRTFSQMKLHDVKSSLIYLEHYFCYYLLIKFSSVQLCFPSMTGIYTVVVVSSLFVYINFHRFYINYFHENVNSVIMTMFLTIPLMMTSMN